MLNINEKQKELLVKAVVGQNELSYYRKGGRFTSESQVYDLFDRDDLRILKTPVDITGVKEDFINANKINYQLVNENVSLTETELTELLAEKGTVASEDLFISSKEVSYDNQQIYISVFNKAFEIYHATVKTMHILKRMSGTKLAVTMEFEQMEFVIEFPFINKLMEAVVNDNIYSFAYMPLNLNEYIKGKVDSLKLSHPYQFLVAEAIKTVGDKVYSLDYFRNMVKRAKGSTIDKFQENINKTLMNVKEFSWSDKNNCPIMWVEPHKSELGRTLLYDNIQLNFDYNTLLTVKDLKGIDLNTGSTSAPGKRCRIAKNYMITRKDGSFSLTKKPNASNEIFDIVNDIKSELYPCFIKTSAKRDNTATIKDTCTLVVPSGYKNRFTLKK